MRGETGNVQTGNVLRLETVDGKSVTQGSRLEIGELGARLRRELLTAIDLGQKAQLLLFRIKNFELLVDTFGADFGVAAEEAVLAQLRSKLRKREPVQKIRDGEFGIVGRGIKSVTALDAMARRMVEAGTGHYEIDSMSCRFKIDIGAAACPEDSEDPEQLLRFARFALGVKDDERSSYQSFSQERFARQKATFWVEAEMEKALAENRFTLMYQPQYAIGSGKITGVEALARMRTRGGEEIPPREFIPVAEDKRGLLRT